MPTPLNSNLAGVVQELQNDMVSLKAAMDELNAQQGRIEQQLQQIQQHPHDGGLNIKL